MSRQDREEALTNVILSSMLEQFECTVCRIEKPLDQFYKRRSRGGIGITRRCVLCEQKRHHAYYEKNKVKFKPSDELGTEKCWKCGEEKAKTEFGKCRSYANGLNPQCKECARNYARTTGNPAARKRDPHSRKSRLWDKYRLRHDRYLEMLEEQGQKCLICDGSFTRTPHVDHDHETGRMKGILYHRCNTWLGVIEQRWFVDKAQAYLASHQGGGTGM